MQKDIDGPLPLKVIQAMVKNRLMEGKTYRISMRCRRGNKWRVRRRTMKCIKKYGQYALFADKNGHRESILYQDLYSQEPGGGSPAG